MFCIVVNDAAAGLGDASGYRIVWWCRSCSRHDQTQELETRKHRKAVCKSPAGTIWQ